MPSKGSAVTPLPGDFKETVQACVRRGPAFGKALFIQGIESFLPDDVETGKAVLRDRSNAIAGFGELGKTLKRSPKTLMRMLGPQRNPQAENLFEIIASFQREEGVRLNVRLAEASFCPSLILLVPQGLNRVQP